MRLGGRQEVEGTAAKRHDIGAETTLLPPFPRHSHSII